MKKIGLQILLLSLVSTVLSQVPGLYNYQAIARNAVGDIFTNQNVSIQIRILQDSTSTSTVYTENFYKQSNEFGLIEFSIGSGIVQYGDFNSIDWTTHYYLIWMGLDTAGGNNFREMGFARFNPVPYALYAEKSGGLAQGMGFDSYTQVEIDTLNAIPSTVVYNLTTQCLNFFTGSNWASLCGDIPCNPPAWADAGPSQSVQASFTNLAGNLPNVANKEIGTWSVIIGTGGIINEPGNPNTVFSGLAGQTYLLAWTLSTACGSNSSTVSVEFIGCDDGNPCTDDYYLNGVCHNEPIVPVIAFAGDDNLEAISPINLEANSTIWGEGQWEIISGNNGILADSADHHSVFEGTGGETYELVWHINHPCGSSSDTVTIAFQIVFNCGDSLIDDRDNQVYATVEIDDQCWMAENLNYGNYVPSTQGQFDNSIPEKYCYSNNPAKCETIGGLYAWNELMQYSTADSARGICPENWHVPSDAEWYAMENYLDNSVNDPTATGFRGTDLHTKLMPGGSSGFNMLYCGIYYQPNNAFYGGGSINRFANYATSTENSQLAWQRTLNEQNVGISRTTQSKLYGIALRCKQDDEQPCSPLPSQANAGPDLPNGPNGSVTLAAEESAIGSGVWTMVAGQGGSFVADTVPTTTFIGAKGQNYELVWTVSTECGSTSDTMLIYSDDPPSANLIKARWGSESINNNGQMELVDLTGVPRPAQGGWAYSFSNGAKMNTSISFAGLDFFHWEFDLKKPIGQTAAIGQSGTGNVKVQFGWLATGLMYVQIGTYYGSFNCSLYDSLLHIKIVYDGTMAGNSERLKISINENLQALNYFGNIPSITPSVYNGLMIGEDQNTVPAFTMANFKNISRSGALLNFYKCDEQFGEISFDCRGNSHGVILNSPSDFHTADNDFTPWADFYGFTEDNTLPNRIIPIAVDSTGTHTFLDINGQTPSYLGGIGANLEIVDNPCIKGNGVDAYIQFTFTEVVYISSIELYYYNGAAWDTVVDQAVTGSSIPGLWEIDGSTFNLLKEGSLYFDKKVSVLICKDAGGDEIIHTNFTSSIDGRAFNRARHTRDGDGYYTNFNSSEFVLDDKAYPVALLEGFDLWEIDNNLGTFILVPYHIDGTPLINDGNTFIGYSWYTNHPPISNYVFHNGAPSKLRLTQAADVMLADLDGVFSNGAGTRYKLSFENLQEATVNPVFYRYGNHKLEDLTLYSQELTGTSLDDANTFYKVKEKDNFVFHGDSQTSGYNCKAGWDYPNQFFRMFESRYQATNLAVPGRRSDQILNNINQIISLYDSSKDDNYAIVCAGSSDLYAGTATPSQIYNNLKAIWAACRNAGFTMVAFTLLPGNGIQSDVDELNTLILSDPTLYDKLVNTTLNQNIGLSGANNGAYFHSDNIHVNEKGQRELAIMLLELIPE
jgi:uncharacterized protein (TIGR02145 family)